MKKILSVIALLICLSPCVFAQDIKYNEDALHIEMPSEWQQLFEDSPIAQDELQAITLKGLLNKGIKLVKAQLTRPLRVLAQIIALLLFAAIARSMCPTGFGNIYNMLDTIVTLAIFALCATPMLELIDKMIMAIDASRIYIASFVPVFASIMISCGEVSSAAVYSGMFFSVVMLIAGLLCKYILPSMHIFLALGIVGSINDNIDFNKIAQVLAKCAKWMLTVSATVFAAVIGLQGALAQSTDSLALKTGKLLVSAGVPVIGKAVSDTIGSVLAGLKLLKGTAAIALVGMLAISFLPLLIEGAIYYLVLTLSSVVAKGTGAEKNARLFDSIAQTISLAMLFVFFFGMMALVSTIMMVLAGGG